MFIIKTRYEKNELNSKEIILTEDLNNSYPTDRSFSHDFDTFFRKQVLYIAKNFYIFIIENIFLLHIYIFSLQCSLSQIKSLL